MKSSFSCECSVWPCSETPVRNSSRGRRSCSKWIWKTFMCSPRASKANARLAVSVGYGAGARETPGRSDHVGGTEIRRSYPKNEGESLLDDLAFVNIALNNQD